MTPHTRIESVVSYSSWCALAAEHVDYFDLRELRDDVRWSVYHKQSVICGSIEPKITGRVQNGDTNLSRLNPV